MRLLNRHLWVGVLFLANLLMILAWEFRSEWTFVVLALSSCLLTFFKIGSLSHKQIAYLATSLGVAYLLGVPADDDAYRYLVEGWAMGEGINPYIVPPTELTSTLSFHKWVNHPDWTAIYGPLFLQLMEGVVFLSSSVLGLKVFWMGVHALNAYLIAKLRSDRVWAHYLCSPFVLMETVGQAHLEVLVVLGALLLVMGLERARTSIYTVGLLMSFWIKWWALPLSLVLFRKNLLKAWVCFGLLTPLVMLPFLDAPLEMFTSLVNFEGMWTNGYPRLWIDMVFGSWSVFLVGVMMMVLLIAVLLLGGSLHEQIWQFFRLGLLLSPTLHPWYWVMPLTMALLSSKTATFALMGAAAMFLHHPEFALAAGQGWECSFWSVLPLIALSLLSEWRLRRHVLGERGLHPVAVTVITPVLNEEENLKEIGSFLSQQRSMVTEWIVVDGGSDDASVDLAESYGATVLRPEIKGRGPQIRAGVEAARTDWVMVLHADTRLTPGVIENWASEISKVPDADGGSLRLAYRGKLALGPLMFLNDLKVRWFGMSFGDQTQFFRKSSLDQRGGFPDLPLMEDVELSMVLKGGNVVYLDHLISWTSPRRWESRGRIVNSLQIIRLLLAYLWNRHWNPPVDVKKMYRSYYSS